MKTIALDFDGVIHNYDRGWHDGSIYGDPLPGAAEALWELSNHNDIAVFILTSRSPKQVVQWLRQHAHPGIPVVRDRRFWPFRRRFWNTPFKVLVTNHKYPAMVYVDDRALRFESWGEWSGGLASQLLRQAAGCDG